MQIQVDKTKIIKQAEKNRLKKIKQYSPEQMEEIINNPDYINDTGRKFAVLGSVIPVLTAGAINELGGDIDSDYIKPILTGTTIAGVGIGYITGRQIANQRIHDINKIKERNQNDNRN